MSKKKITLTVSDELFDSIDDIAKKMGLTRNSYCTYIVASTIFSTNAVLDGAVKGLNNIMEKNIEELDSK